MDDATHPYPFSAGYGGVSGILHFATASPVTASTAAGGPADPAGGLPAVDAVVAAVDASDHDRVSALAAWLDQGGDCRSGVEVTLAASSGGGRALLLGERREGGLAFSLVPLGPDPVARALELLIDRRSLDAVLEAAVTAYAQLGIPVWATVHYDRDAEHRFRSVVAATGLDTFRRSIEAAVRGDMVCVWDLDPEDAGTYRVGEVGEGIAIAGRHVGMGACHVTPLGDDADGGAAAALVLWGETAELLQHPGVRDLHDRVQRLVDVALTHEQDRARIEWAEDHDDLTGLLNRRAFFTMLRSPAAQRRCAIACLDVDDFSEINRSHGASGGDLLLTEVANRLSDIMRPGDRVARVSSNRFAVLYADVSGASLDAIGGRLHQLFEASFPMAGSASAVSVSIGIAGSTPEYGGVRLFDLAERTLLDVQRDAPGSWRVA